MLDFCVILGLSLYAYNRKDVVQPALHKGIFLAPTTKQRLQYQNYLSVFGKDKVQVTENMFAVIKEFHVRYLRILCIVVLNDFL